MKRSEKLRLAQAVFDMATCYGEEPQGWFQPSLFAMCLGVDIYDVEDALAYLQGRNRLRVWYGANGSCHVKQVIT